MNWKLLAGRMRDAWRDYPEARRRIAAVPAGAPIFLTGTHRSGTTWLAKMLAATGIWYIHEPFSPKKGRWPRSFEYREPGRADPAVDALFGEVLAGGFRAAANVPDADHPLLPLRLFRARFERILVKDPLACLLTEYLTRRHGLQTLILFRHPAGFSASVHRLGWPRASFLRSFLQDEALMARHLEPHRALMERHADRDDIASAAVLHGALNAVLWRCVEDGIGTPLLFEELCRDPLEQLQALFGRLQLPYDERIREVHRRACHGDEKPVEAYRTHAVSRNSMAMAGSWRGKLGDADCERVRDIWTQFGIPLYVRDEDWVS